MPQGLMVEGAWDLPAGGGSVLDQWPGIAAAISPALSEHVQAVAFHAESGQLDLRSDPSAYATQLRLISARIVAATHETVGAAAVRTVRVLAVGATAANAPDVKQSHDRPGTPWRSQRPVAPRNTTAPAMTSTAERKVCRRALRSFSRTIQAGAVASSHRRYGCPYLHLDYEGARRPAGNHAALHVR
ncbi:DciA family protein [Streptomyces sp. DT203]|uniref:DciA family protein n=1 Tax=Streptomyces sp. DT203 TaxID=3393424 RepID=UPI003CE7FEF8